MNNIYDAGAIAGAISMGLGMTLAAPLHFAVCAFTTFQANSSLRNLKTKSLKQI
jgi:hypothetical protein